MLAFIRKEVIGLFTIIYFSIAGVLVYVNYTEDEGKSTINALIRKDLAQDNGTEALFEKLKLLINGQSVKASSSPFSFKQVQYSLHKVEYNQLQKTNADRVTFRYKNSGGMYYFYYGGRTISVDPNNLDSISVNWSKDGLGFNDLIVDPKKGIFWDLQDAPNHPFNTRPENGLIPVGYSFDFNTQYWALPDSSLTKMAQSDEDLNYYIDHDLLYSFYRDSSTLVVTPIFRAREGGRGQKDTMLDLSKDMKYISQVYGYKTRFFVKGTKNRQPVKLTYSSNNFRKINAEPEIGLAGSEGSIHFDTGGNLLFETPSDTLLLGKDSLRKNGIDFFTINRVYRLFSSDGRLRLYMVWSQHGRFFPSKIAVLTRTDGDSLAFHSLGPKAFTYPTVFLNDMLFLTRNGTRNLQAYNLGGDPKTLKDNDSLLLGWVSHLQANSSDFNPDGIFLLRLDDIERDFVILHRVAEDKFTATFKAGGSWNISDSTFTYNVIYNYYYLVILICLTIIVYYFSLIGLQQLKNLAPQQLPDNISTGISSEDYKLQLTFTHMESLRRRSEIMLRLGISFGIFGVLVSAFVFESSNLNLGKEWNDPHTLLGVLKPVVILVFMETFTFYFLKQYRIIFNEFKLYYSIFLDLLSTQSILDLEKREIADKKLLQLLRDRLSRNGYDMYEKDTKEKIKEFNEPDYKAAAELIGKMRDGKS